MIFSRHPDQSEQGFGKGWHGRVVLVRTFARLTNRSMALVRGSSCSCERHIAFSLSRILSVFSAVVQHVDVCPVSHEMVLPCGSTSIRPVTVVILFFQDSLPAIEESGLTFLCLPIIGQAKRPGSGPTIPRQRCWPNDRSSNGSTRCAPSGQRPRFLGFLGLTTVQMF